MAGNLYLVSTPIGNLEDITFRAVRTLQECDLIAAEDTRHTALLLQRYDIHKPLESFHAFNEHNKVEKLIARIKEGLNVALVSDAGTPAVADPGFLPLRAALESGLEPVVIPGVSAVTFSVTASGLPVDRFAFWNFVPVKSGRKRKFFEEISECGYTVFCFESPFRIENTLKIIAEVMPEARVAIIREATKVHEEVIRGSAAELASLQQRWRGEFVIGICNKSKRHSDEEFSDS
ncbi:MAG: 16S rRNA (cytidine(1402)-2'-O)-methyltransferase [Lentisphaeria bacterium]|nr:16S rRNA (cytidine(1402)-2'-O)-methyltransferase [Lentisphaeria bacterium]